MKCHSEQTNQIEKPWQPAVEELEQRLVPGTLTITTSSGITSSQEINTSRAGQLSIAQSHANGVITWTP